MSSTRVLPTSNGDLSGAAGMPSTSTSAASQLRYVCASCFSPQTLPRPSPTGTLFQCTNCRLSSAGEIKVLYVSRSFAVEHSTR